MAGVAFPVATSSPNGTEIITGLVFSGALGIDIVGVYLLVACVCVVAIYLTYCSFHKWYAARGQMSSLEAGRIRLTAARGELATLQLLKHKIKNFEPNAEILGFTALAAACCSQQPGKQLEIGCFAMNTALFFTNAKDLC